MIAENNELHLHTIIHPKLTEKENGKRKPPTPYDLKGGSEWFNSGKCMITVDRDSLENNICTLYFNKIKPRSNGSIGQKDLYFDVNKLTYFSQEIIMGNVVKKYASEKGTAIVEQKPLHQMQPNQSFYEPKDKEIDFTNDDKDTPF